MAVVVGHLAPQLRRGFFFAEAAGDEGGEGPLERRVVVGRARRTTCLG
jgi:hypothetical protein